MDGRLIIADDAVDLTDAVNHVIIFLMLLNKFEQRARSILNRVIVLRVELSHVAFGSVVYDADYLIADLTPVSFLSAWESVIGALMILGFVFLRNDASVAPFFILALVFGEPDLFRAGEEHVERVGCSGWGHGRNASSAVFIRQIRVHATRRPHAERIDD